MPGPGLRSSPNAACWSNRRHVSGARAENLKGSMKLKRLISLLLLAIYLTAWGGPAYVSLSCKCVTMSSHVCCHHCQHSADAAGAGESLKAPCCGNHHSTEIEIYTGPQVLRGDASRMRRSFRHAGPCALRRPSCPSRIGLKPFWDGCCAHPPANSFNQ